jgi:hypothetical protein
MASTTSTASSNPTSDSEVENIPMDCTLLAELEDEADDLPDPDEEEDDEDEDDDDEDNEENEDEFEEVCMGTLRGNWDALRYEERNYTLVKTTPRRRILRYCV